MPTPQIRRVLIANRGEIAVRICRTLKDLGIDSVAVYPDVDASALHVRTADRAVALGPDPRAYLDIEAVVRAALAAGADAVHPGYGFLSESAAFARACTKAGLVFIGPTPQAMEAMGDKISAKRAAVAAGVPVVPGRHDPGMSDAQITAAVAEIGLPVILKPAAGGGGKGMRVVAAAQQLPAAIAAARREAAASFGDDTLLVERYISAPRHIEVQILADSHGTVVALADRECSLQRRHQKVVEEAPALLAPGVKAAMHADAVRLMRATGYLGAGTVEFIVDAGKPDEYFFLEVNTRLQVEHPVTEEVLGLDLVAEQIAVARGEPLGTHVTAASPRGHAVEARLYAEDPATGFLPTGGPVLALVDPGGSAVRMDTGVQAGDVVSTDFDPMVAKIIARGADRGQALQALAAGLRGLRILGLRTNQEFLLALATHPEVVAGQVDTGWIDRNPQLTEAAPIPAEALVAAAGERLLAAEARAAGADLWHAEAGWRLGEPAWASWRMAEPGGAPYDVAVRGTSHRAEVRVVPVAQGQPEPDAGPGRTVLAAFRGRPGPGGGRIISVQADGRSTEYLSAGDASGVWLAADGATWRLRESPRLAAQRHGAGAADWAEVRSPMPGTVIALPVEAGQQVAAGEALAVVEAMKMEHVLAAAQAARVASVAVQPGDKVALDQLVVRLEALEPSP